MEMEDKREQQILHTQTLKAGKRTYFFDVKQTIRGEYYLCITESKKIFDKNDGNFQFKKHSVFLYQENMKYFTDILKESIDFITKNQKKVQEFREVSDQEENKE